MKKVAWAIWFKGDYKEKAGICWWYGDTQIFETKQEAKLSLEDEIKGWANEKDFEIRKVLITLVK